MAFFVRILPKRCFYKELGRFSSEAFKNYKGSISVICHDCMLSTSTTECQHLEFFYNSVDSPPFLYWLFDNGIIPADCNWDQKNSESGDECHYNISNLKDKLAKRILSENLDYNLNLFICDNKIPRNIADNDLANLA